MKHTTMREAKSIRLYIKNFKLLIYCKIVYSGRRQGGIQNSIHWLDQMKYLVKGNTEIH